jgi:phage RecT family recombinase
MSNLITLTTSALAAPKDLKGVFELEPFKNNFVRNLVKTSGKTEEAAEMTFEREKILFMKAIQSNKALEKCDRFTIYSAFIELAVSGVSLNEGESYIIPYSSKAQFQIGYKGRVKQMQEIPGFQYVNMPQVVYTSDDFDYELGEEPKVLRHKPAKKKGPDDVIEFVYLVIELSNDRRKTFIMDREQVLNIRDHYSTPYIQYVAEIERQGKKIGDKVVKRMKGRDGGADWDLTIEPPMWVTSEEESFKKTIVKRAYKWVPKTPKLRALDAKIAGNQDPEDGVQAEEAFNIDYGIQNEDGTTQEIKADAPAKTKPAATKSKATAPAPPVNDAAKDLADMQSANTSADQTQDVDHTEVNEPEPEAQGEKLPDLGNLDAF